jgi:4a-hydroxytetrahydrobiopterin dehydratase
MAEDATGLAEERCVACRRDSPRVEPEEAAALIGQIPGWTIVQRDGMPRLERTYKFGDYPAALRFVQRVGELSEREGHHPVMEVRPRRVTVWWWTHAIKNLHRNDFVMAAKTDALADAG